MWMASASIWPRASAGVRALIECHLILALPDVYKLTFSHPITIHYVPLPADEKGNPMAVPPLIRAICKHPVLSKVKLIAEPWDLGMYQVGSFPNWDVWAEWNGKYRDDLRRFIKGEPGV